MRNLVIGICSSFLIASAAFAQSEVGIALRRVCGPDKKVLLAVSEVDFSFPDDNSGATIKLDPSTSASLQFLVINDDIYLKSGAPRAI